MADIKEAKKEPKKEPTRARAPHPGASPRAARRGASKARAAGCARRRAAAAAGVARSSKNRPSLRSGDGARAQALGISHDAGLRSVVSLLAAGHDLKDLAWLAANVPKQRWWRESGRNHGLASLSPEVVARALEERDCSAFGQRRNGGSTGGLSEERRITRNALLENAKAGQHGPRYQRRVSDGSSLRELADELEHLREVGQLRVVVAGAPPTNTGAPSGERHRAPAELHASRPLAALMETIQRRVPVKCAPPNGDKQRKHIVG